jgi:integrase
MADTLMQNQRRRTLTDKMVAALPKKQKRYTKPDPEQGGHYVRVMPDGANVFVAVARDPHGKQVWHTIGSADVLQISEARERARKAIRRIKDGLPPVEAPPVKPYSVKAVAESWLQRHVAKKKLRTEDEIKRCLNKYVYDHWADHNFVNIKRSDITTLLDHIEDDHGSRQADLVLAILRSIANWFASRDDSYVSPFTRGMRRHERGARTRILTDDELRAVWKQGEQHGAFGAIVRLALLTAQRREKIRTMKWSDVSIDGKWTIAADEREKGNAGTLVLPPQALSIITIQPRLADNPYVFAGRGNGCFDVSQSKPRFDKGCGVTGWTLHDCRRTARSLMSRAGVRPDVSERVMGHTIPGVAGVYDRHGYIDEKADALRRLAGLIATILNPPKGNVRQLRGAKR